MAINHSVKTRQFILGYRVSTKMRRTIGTPPCTLRQPWVSVSDCCRIAILQCIFCSGCGASVGYSCCGSGCKVRWGWWHSGRGDGVGGDGGDRLC